MSASAEDLEINLEIVSANRDRIKMLTLLREVVSRPDLPDYVLLVNELLQGPAMTKFLESTGIPYLFLFNRLSRQQRHDLERDGLLNHYLGSIAPNNHETGYMTAKALIKAQRAIGDTTKEKMQMLALLGDTATPAAVEREAGMRQAVAEAADVELVRAFSVD